MHPMHVFAEIDTSRPKKREQLLKARDLLLGLVTTIIYNNIKRRNPTAKFAPERTVRLVANEDLDPIAFISTTVG
jgi:hypothetical protein